MTEQELQAIEAREQAATKGPWTASWDNCGGCEGGWDIDRVETNGHGIAHAADAAFIANTRQDVPLLTAELRRLQGLIKQAETVELSGGDGCPWCGSPDEGLRARHEPTCPAFPPSEVP